MPRASAINKKKVQKNLFGNRLSPTEDTDAVFEQSEKLARKILEEKEERVSQEIKKRTELSNRNQSEDLTDENLSHTASKANNKKTYRHKSDDKTKEPTNIKTHSGTIAEQKTSSIPEQLRNTEFDKKSEPISSKQYKLRNNSGIIPEQTTKDIPEQFRNKPKELRSGLSINKEPSIPSHSSPTDKTSSTKLSDSVSKEEASLPKESQNKRPSEVSTLTTNTTKPIPEQFRNNSGTPIKEKAINSQVQNNTFGPISRNNCGTIAEQNNQSYVSESKLPEQLRNNPGTIPEQIAEQSLNYSGTVPEQKTPPITTNKTFYSISGNGRKILMHIGRICMESGNLITPPLVYSELANLLQIKNGEVVRKTIGRLIKSGLLNKIESRSATGGYIILGIEPLIYKEIVNTLNEPQSPVIPELFRNTSIDTQVQSSGTNSGTNASSSSNYINNNINKETTITTYTELPTQENIFNLDPKWMEIDFFGLNEKDKISFGMNDLKKIAEKKLLSSEQVQESLEAFANDFEKGIVKSKGSKRNLFIGTLLKGNQYYSLDQGFKSAEDQFLEEQLRIKIQKDKERKKLEEEASEIYFKEWLETIPDNEKDSLLKDNGYYIDGLKDGSMKIGFLKSYYMDHHWPKVMEEFRSSLGSKNPKN